MERLDKFLCDSGVGTRSQVKPIIKSGRVTLDGVAVRDPSAKFDPQKQTLCLDGEPLGGKRRIVVMLNKPAGFVTATEDKTERTVMELLPKQMRCMDLKPVGRLDKATEGLLLLTNDGDLLHRLISPKKEVPKIYYAKHEGTATEKDVVAFEDLYKSSYLKTEYVNAVGNYFKKPGYTACEYMMIICAADVAEKERFTTRQYVDLLRYCLPVAEKCTSLECRCVFFAAGGDWHIAMLDNKTQPVFDHGLRVAGNYNLETMWEKLRK